jgi:membrane fusion protein (multidrug efflux system)
VEVVDPASPDLVLSATPADAARIPPGAAVAVRSGESRSGARLGAGKVVDVGAAVDSATRTVTVRARVTAGERPLRIGETVYAEIDARTIPRALTIPAAALLPDGDGFRVFVVGADGLAEARAVEVGVRSDSLVEVVRGLKEGERIVGAGAYGVEDSAKVVEAP